jgi:hypothetical protein
MELDTLQNLAMINMEVSMGRMELLYAQPFSSKARGGDSIVKTGQEFHQNLQLKTEPGGWVLNRRIL